ncbi:MAG: preprotein translocase subunit SecE [Vampirovibrionales bacterium]|nr:preprotein translocase subunit SecE [Vampirovibrionales bacterium]
MSKLPSPVPNGNAVPHVPMWSQLTTYFAGLKAEAYKITWPTLPQIIGQTILTIFVVTLSTMLIWSMDYLWHALITLIVPVRHG